MVPSTRPCSLCTDCDHDGHLAVQCGGDDCDDDDARRYPGNTEVCDAAGHDEDCNYATFGVRDMDGDGYIDNACFNTAPNGTRYHGNDCNDNEALVHPGTMECTSGNGTGTNFCMADGTYFASPCRNGPSGQPMHCYLQYPVSAIGVCAP